MTPQENEHANHIHSANDPEYAHETYTKKHEHDPDRHSQHNHGTHAEHVHGAITTPNRPH